jgi:hypothetical protein
MKDSLQRFIRDNKENFDDAEPTEGLWTKINERIPQKTTENTPIVAFANNSKKPQHQWFNWRMAASVVLVLGVGWAFYVNREYQVVAQPELALADLSSAKQVADYTRQIDQKRDELYVLINNDPTLQKEFGGELGQLEKSYQSLKASLPENLNQEVVIEAMIQNLQWQIDILNQQLIIIQKIKQSKNNEKYKETLV